MNSLIHFRDQGCQGAMDILNEIISLNASTKTVSDIKEHGANRIVYLINTAPLDTESEAIKSIKLDIYKEIANQLSISFIESATIENIQRNDIVILDSKFLEFLPELKNKEILICLLEDLQSDFASPYALSAFSLFAYTALRTNKKIEDISINWIGDAGKEYELLTKSLLNATVCNKNYLAYSFEDNKEESLICAPHADTLDFAMSAGAKIFLTHDAGFLEEDADIVYLAKWSHVKGAGLQVKHPFSYAEIRQYYTDKSQIISFLSDIKSSPIDEALYNTVALNTRLVALSYLLTK